MKGVPIFSGGPRSRRLRLVVVGTRKRPPWRPLETVPPLLPICPSAHLHADASVED